jgi:hypothetical protein
MISLNVFTKPLEDGGLLMVFHWEVYACALKLGDEYLYRYSFTFMGQKLTRRLRGLLFKSILRQVRR